MKSTFKTMTSPVRCVCRTINKISLSGKVLMVVVLFLAANAYMRAVHPKMNYSMFEINNIEKVGNYLRNDANFKFYFGNDDYYNHPANSTGEKEGFTETSKFLFYDGNKVYDDFYSDIYDQLVYNAVLDDYEIGTILNSTKPTSQSIILDIGSGTGHIVSKLSGKDMNVTGMDVSTSMIKKAKENYPDLNFVEGDALNASAMTAHSFTHIMCLYFTFYYMKDQQAFFNNTMRWLKPGGYLIVHLVDREMFDPIIPPANPLIMLTPQRYAKQRIMKSSVTFDDFKYNAEFKLDKDHDTAQFVEKFHFTDGKTRKNEHTMYMPNITTVTQYAQDAGFIVQGSVDLIQSGYEYQYLYIFVKPN